MINISIDELNIYIGYGRLVSVSCRDTKDRIVAIDFYRKDCVPCIENMIPLLEVVSGERPDIDWYKLEKPFAVKMMPMFNLNCYPTVIFYRDGKEFARYEGYESDEHFREFLKGIK